MATTPLMPSSIRVLEEVDDLARNGTLVITRGWWRAQTYGTPPRQRTVAPPRQAALCVQHAGGWYFTRRPYTVRRPQGHDI